MAFSWGIYLVIYGIWLYKKRPFSKYSTHYLSLIDVEIKIKRKWF
ncbi:hypothetical protein SAMN05444362_102363 [Dysgonomonas macrotermitis]|uniref:Uncharacterized protein n=1 Tax=Dysgonomonas macrotermitis TaxID=1346286 RepID=A0A1M4WZL9_9BACT|nr:hypothetical protein SAMN05444362_102363 [Dysgonomonas macrotermitis]